MRSSAILLLLPLLAPAAGFDHSAWDRVLKRSVSEIGEVDYGALKKDHAEFDQYLEQLRAVSPVNKPELFPTRAEQMAYWINAYNALVTKGIVDHYPVKSVRNIGLLFSFFRSKDWVVGGETMSLDHIEHDTLRAKYGDPRVHVAIVCASLSCPKLSRNAFTAENLDRQLDELLRAFVAERRNVLIDPQANTITYTQIFQWYGGDFEKSSKGTLLDYIRPYLSEEQRKQIAAMKSPRIRFKAYDWAINDPGSRARASSPYERELAKKP